MKKKKLVLFSLFLFLLVGIGGFGLYRHHQSQRVHNIFDEIYYDEEDSYFNLLRFGYSTFSKLKGVDYFYNHAPEAYSHLIYYNEKFLFDDLTKLSYSFYFNDARVKEGISIEIKKKLPQTNIIIAITYYYFVKSKTIERQVRLYSKDSSIEEIRDKEGVSNFLQANGTSLEQEQAYGEKLLKDKLLKDWCSIYQSRYSPTKWGQVKRSDKWE